MPHVPPDELEVTDEMEDPVKAQELRIEGNESFKVRRLFLSGHVEMCWHKTSLPFSWLG